MLDLRLQIQQAAAGLLLRLLQAVNALAQFDDGAARLVITKQGCMGADGRAGQQAGRRRDGERAGRGRRPAGTNAAPADGSDKPAGAGADSVKRVKAAPATAADGKGE